MGIVTRTATTQEGSVVLGNDTNTSKVSSSSSSMNNHIKQKRWSNLMPLLVALVIIGEIAFLGRLDMAKNAAMVHTWTNSFNFTSLGGEYFQSQSKQDPLVLDLHNNNNNNKNNNQNGVKSIGRSKDVENCEVWLEREENIPYSRDFRKEPIWVSGSEQLQETSIKLTSSSINLHCFIFITAAVKTSIVSS